jgi:phosphate transport system substrate-binding protein
LFLQCISIAQTTLIGAGATFPSPIYSKWFDEYHRQHPGGVIKYQAIGSGGGIAQLTKGAIDFGATDGPMTDDQVNQLRERRGIEVIHIPTVVGAVVPVYNLPEVDTQLKFSGELLAQIFLGNVTRWDDPGIAKENPGVKLPDKKINVVHRTDSSNTTYIFTDFLSKTSPEWKNRVGSGMSVQWPVGVRVWPGGGGEKAYSLDGAIAYFEWIYAVHSHMTIASVKNAAGKYITASPESIAAAAASAELPEDFRAFITNAAGDNAYPMACLAWLLIPRTWDNTGKRKAMVDFLNWMLDSGQTMTSDLYYVPLPENLVAEVRAKIKEIK